MNSEDQTAPPPGVAVVTTPEGVQQRNSHTGSQPHKRARNRKRHRNRNRKRNHNRNPNHNTTPQEDRPPVTEGTQLHQARQNHSTFDRDLHHRGQGGTGYGYRRDVTQPESELRGDQLPTAVLPSYAHILTKIHSVRGGEYAAAESPVSDALSPTAQD